jgi:SP family galactose:H+ symporter-like MFS transporter
MNSECTRGRGLLVGLTAASLGVVYGYDLSNIAGALLFITEEFGLTTRQQELVTSAVVLGEIAGALGAGMLANAIGRRRSMMLVAAGYAAFALLGAMSVSEPMLLVARLLLGVTIGVSVVVVPVFLAESAPAKVRGSLLVAYQAATVLGIIAGYLTAYLLADSHGICSRVGSPRPGRRCSRWSRTATSSVNSQRLAMRCGTKAAAGSWRCCAGRTCAPPSL